VIPLLQPLFPGELAVHGEKLQCAAAVPPGAVRVAELVQSPALLAGVLRQNARYRGVAGTDLRPVASAWSLEYIAMLLPPVMAAASMLQHVFPIAAEQAWVRLDAHGAPAGFHIRHIGRPHHGADAAERYAPLLWQHLAPLFEALAASTRLAPKILWSNTARLMEPVFDVALAATGGATSIVRDRQQLLHSAAWPGAPRPNPLHGRERKHPVKLHRECCLNYLLPHEHHCNACPLAPEHRGPG
jgi:ferric iron reductase protein FhuF